MTPIPELVKKHYKPPYQYDGIRYLWDDNSNMCLMLAHDGIDIEEEIMKRLVSALNGEKEFKNDAEFAVQSGNIYCNSFHVLTIRGWGRLSSKFKDEVAADIQDTFAQYIVDVLNNKVI